MKQMDRADIKQLFKKILSVINGFRWFYLIAVPVNMSGNLIA